ncbi:hypothetical protein P355_2024 [Burkholderia cenocepacia KC-01]|nr:hypothetical protein P355_2024 [Burkholderia cenocepacia KC-01]
MRALLRRQRGQPVRDADRLLGHVDPLAVCAHLRIRGRRLGGHHDAHRIGRGLHRVGVGLRGIDQMAHAAPQIDFPRQRERRRETPARARIGVLGRRDDLVGRVLAVVDAEAGRRVGQPRGTGLVEHGARALDPRHGRRKIAVLRERIAHETVEYGIVVQPPPALRRFAGGRGRHVGHRVERPRARRVGHRRPIRLADRTRGQRGRRQQHRRTGGAPHARQACLDGGRNGRSGRNGRNAHRVAVARRSNKRWAYGNFDLCGRSRA